ncbi:phosphotransferase [Kineococcus sp. SYSU DK005]|uniref:phosphotransferase n=1 Tax=Kineococcus sp. SYSU DK005 TaxID=3383126 RepID=UPI003D7D0C79
MDAHEEAGAPRDAGAPQVEEVLHSGNSGGAVRIGASVRRPAGAWTPTIQRLLAHLHRRGVTQVPAPLGIDEHGRDSTSHLPGQVPQHPLPSWVWRGEVLTDAARLLAQLHAASAGFDTHGANWRLSGHEPVQVICHNDVAPYNRVFTDQRLSGLIDWDTASPGPRV